MALKHGSKRDKFMGYGEEDLGGKRREQGVVAERVRRVGGVGRQLKVTVAEKLVKGPQNKSTSLLSFQ